MLLLLTSRWMINELHPWCKYARPITQFNILISSFRHVTAYMHTIETYSNMWGIQCSSPWAASNKIFNLCIHFNGGSTTRDLFPLNIMHTKGHESSDSGHRSAIAQTDSVPATPEDTMLPFSFTQDESLQLNAEISGHFALFYVG